MVNTPILILILSSLFWSNPWLDASKMTLLIFFLDKISKFLCKDKGSIEGYWNQFRGGYERRGSNSMAGCMNPSICNYDEMAIWDDGSCSTKDYECKNGTQGCDCHGECNGFAEKDCIGVCNGSLVDDVCDICGGDNTSCTGCTDPNASNHDPDAIIDDGNCILDIDDLQIIPEIFSISNIHPNPFNPITTIQYELTDYGLVNIFVYDISGRQVVQLYNNYQSSGFYSIKWNASSFPSGLYFIQMTSNDVTDARKVLLIK